MTSSSRDALGREVILVGSSRVHFSQHSPQGTLKSIAKTIWRAQGTQVEFNAPDPIVPDGCVEIIFNLGDPFRDQDGILQPRALLAGQMTHPVVAVPTGDVDLLGIRLFTGRGGAAIRVPMWQLQDRLLDAAAVVSGVDRLADDLRNMPNGRRLDHIGRTLFTDINGRRKTAIDHALAIIDASHGNISVDAVARRVGITRRHLERRFKDEVGLGVKQMARIRRVHAALRLMERRPPMSGAEISAHCGYSDQAHLIRECKALTGRTPAALMTTARSLGGMMREGAVTHSV